MGRPIVARHRGKEHFKLIEVETLKIGSTPAEITASAAELNLNDNQVASITWVVDAEGGEAIAVHAQFLDAAGVAMATRSAIHWYISDDAAGDSVSSAPQGGTAGGTDGVTIETLAEIAGIGISEADGDWDITVTDNTTVDYFIVAILPNGSLSVSGELAFST